MARSGGGQEDSWEYLLRKYLLLLAALVATATYDAGFNPPGGVWQTADPANGRIAGDPIIRNTNHARYLAFFYSNATAFASSLVVIVLILILSLLRGRRIKSPELLRILRLVMVLDLICLMAAYAAGTFRDAFTAVYSLLLLAGVIAYLVVQLLLDSRPQEDTRDQSTPEQLRRKRLMLLATFVGSVTYVSGLSAPGGFWDHKEQGHNPGDAILKGSQDARLKAFFVSNTTAFVASLLILVMLLKKKPCFSTKYWSYFELYGLFVVTLLGLLVAYAACSSRKIVTTIYASTLVGAVAVYILLQVVFAFLVQANSSSKSSSEQESQGPSTNSGNGSDDHRQQQIQALEKARFLVLLLATLGVAITYKAGLNPPGGLWQEDGDGYQIGDPILLNTNPKRYKAFYYCNSVAFVASLVAIVLVWMKTLHHRNALVATMILDLLALIGAYAAGCCREVRTSMYVMFLAVAVLFYVPIHVIFTSDHKDGSRRGNDEASLRMEKEAEELVEKRRKRLLLFAILAATITYQAGLTPPGGFLVEDDQATGRHAGDPVLLNNYRRRYTVFFYCNSVSFMLSITLILLLMYPILYRLPIRSNALSICTVAGLTGIIGSYAAGVMQHLKTSIYIFALGAMVLSSVVLLIIMFFMIHPSKPEEDRAVAAVDNAKEEGLPSAPGNHDGELDLPLPGEVPPEKDLHTKHKYLMLLGIMMASLTYQAGLAPPGGMWQSNDGMHTAGDPVMYDNQRTRYLAFFYSNSTSFVASVTVIILLLPESLHKKMWWLRVMNSAIVADLLGLLIAYAAGSTRTWKTSAYVSGLIIAMIAYFVIHVVLSCFIRRDKRTTPATPHQQNEQGNGFFSLCTRSMGVCAVFWLFLVPFKFLVFLTKLFCAPCFNI